MDKLDRWQRLEGLSVCILCGAGRGFGMGLASFGAVMPHLRLRRGVFIKVGLLGPRLNLCRHVSLEAVDNGAAERTLNDSLKSACEADEGTQQDAIWRLNMPLP